MIKQVHIWHLERLTPPEPDSIPRNYTLQLASANLPELNRMLYVAVGAPWKTVGTSHTVGTVGVYSLLNDSLLYSCADIVKASAIATITLYNFLYEFILIRFVQR